MVQMVLLESIDVPKLKDLVNIVFFCVIGSVAVLTYLKAKRTLLQPLRTEVFKIQLGLFSQILEEFVARSEVELRSAFDLDLMIKANCYYQLDIYVANFFGKEFKESTRLYRRENCPQSLFFVDSRSLEAIPVVDEVLAFRGREGSWIRGEVIELRLPKRYLDSRARLERFMRSPLTPTELAGLLEEYLSTVEKIVSLIRSELGAYCGEFTARYPDLAALNDERIVPVDVWNRFHDDPPRLEPTAQRIVGYVRAYFEVDEFADSLVAKNR